MTPPDSPYKPWVPDYKFPSYQEQNDIINRFITSDREEYKNRKYTLFIKSCIIEGDYYKRTGTITDRVCLMISSNDLKYLEDFWKNNEVAHQFDSTAWHYIYDNFENKLVKTLSICY